MKHWMTIAVLLLSGFAPVWAQDSDVEELNLIELELRKGETTTRSSDDSEPTSSEATRTQGAETKNSESPTYDDLGNLVEFKQVSVIQKRYLPRTGRFQAYLGPSITLNDPWFNVYGGTLRLGYNFLEAWGIEAGYSFMSTNKSQARKELADENNITTENFVYTKSYYNIDINWTPLYGKMAWFNERILYYDTYFSVGFGGTEIQTGDVQSTFHFGFGQIFSISKSTAFRWDLSWNFFEADQIDNSQGAYNNVFLSAGLSFFFPEATYR